jgi:hypothetical protein
MALPLTFDLDIITISSAASHVASANMAVAIATVQAAATTYRECTTPVVAVSQQEQAALAATIATTSGAPSSTNLVATLSILQARVSTSEAEAQQPRVVVAALELHLVDIVGVTAPLLPHPAVVPVATPRHAAPTVSTFEASSISYLHA